MKRLFLLLIAFTALTLSAQQDRRVYITLDVSGSMWGAKYELANYTSQMIITMCEPEDEVYFIIEGAAKQLTGQAQLGSIQKPFGQHDPGPERESQFGDIVGFNRLYKPVKGKQDWLFVVGDGIWGTESYHDDCRKFRSTVAGGTLNVCYLQTGTNMLENNDFTDFAQDLGVVDIRKSSTDPSTIRKGCNYFARKILSFSDVDLKVKASGSTLKLKAELPVREFVVVYQDEVQSSALPSMNSAAAGGSVLTCQLKGTPSTEMLQSSNGGKVTLLSGRVWRVKASSPIAAGTEVELHFDKSFKSKCINVYPIVDEQIYSAFTLRPLAPSKTIDDRTTAVCRDQNNAEVYVELSDDATQALPESLLKATKVVIKSDNNSYTARYHNGRFECDIPLNSDETQYYAEVDCPGYFHHTTPIRKIVRTSDCQPTNMPTNELPPTEGGSLRFDQLEIIAFTIHDEETQNILDPTKFDLTVELDDDFLFEKPTLRIDGNNIYIENLKPKGQWCECLFPDDITIRVVSTPKPGASFDDGKQYQRTVMPLHYTIEKPRPWFSRCLWVLLTIAGLLAFIIYLRLLLKKNRFRKNARITPVYWKQDDDDENPTGNQGGHRLRKKGLGAWFCRWFLPFDERREVLSNKPHACITFYATESGYRIKFDKGTFNRETMTVTGYDPDQVKRDEHYIDLRDRGEIVFTKKNGMRDGKLIFTAGNKDDEGGYRLFVTIVIIGAVIAIIVLLWLMLKGLF